MADEINVGDLVKVIEGRHFGKYGIVKAINSLPTVKNGVLPYVGGMKNVYTVAPKLKFGVDTKESAKPFELEEGQLIRWRRD